jgi:single-stranded-DNA-specific exonuclease
LNEINLTRRDIEQDMKTQALALVEARLAAAGASVPAGICLYDESWHQGVVGILASRIKELYHRPVIAFAPGEAQEIKGSARSIPGVHIRDVLDAIATQNPGLLGRFGGHAMAAGLSLRAADIPRF